jgi:putative PIN family toxin of toxin-antitoxin system
MSGIFWSGYPGKILDAWQAKKIKLVISPDIITEYIRVGNALAKKYEEIDVTPFIDLVIIYGELVSPDPLATQISRDAEDDKFIAAAQAAKCNIIVSGDKDLLDIDIDLNIEIIKPAAFVKKYL